MTRLPVRFVSLLAALTLGCLGLAMNPQPASACSCMGITTATALRNADVVFAGVMTRKDEMSRPKPGRTDIRFSVAQVYKGQAFADQVVASPIGSATCGFSPRVGGTWVVFATEGVEGTGDQALSRLVTGLCSGNLPSSVGPTSLGPGRAPQPGASDRDEWSTQTDTRVTHGFMIAGVGVLVAVALVGLALAVLWRPRTP